MPLTSEIEYPEWVRTCVKIIEDSLDTALEKRLGLLQPLQPLPLQPWQQQPFVPLPAQLPKQQKEQEKPLPQAIAEYTAESMPDNKSRVSTILRQSAKQLCREWTPYTGFLASFLISSLASFFGFGSFLASFLAPLLASLLGYIECMEGMEATGQG